MRASVFKKKRHILGEGGSGLRGREKEGGGKKRKRKLNSEEREGVRSAAPLD